MFILHLLWPVWGEKEDKEEEKVGETRTYIQDKNIYVQNKSVSTAGSRSVRPKTIRFDCWEKVSRGVSRVSIYEEEFIIV